MKKIILSILPVLFLCISVNAQPLEKIKDVKEKAEKVAELFAFNKYGPAVDEMAPFWSIDEERIKEFKEQTIDKMVTVQERYGSTIGYEFISDQKISDFVYKTVYFVKFKYIAMRLSFIFYKNNAGWTLNTFVWDMDFEEELD